MSGQRDVTFTVHFPSTIVMWHYDFNSLLSPLSYSHFTDCFITGPIRLAGCRSHTKLYIYFLT